MSSIEKEKPTHACVHESRSYYDRIKRFQKIQRSERILFDDSIWAHRQRSCDLTAGPRPEGRYYSLVGIQDCRSIISHPGPLSRGPGQLFLMSRNLQNAITADQKTRQRSSCYAHEALLRESLVKNIITHKCLFFCLSRPLRR